LSTRLVILGLLRQRPLYGYEIKHIIEDHMGDWTSIAFGSIYFALNKLAEEGYIEKIATEQEGGRPSRSVYQITAEGREEFLRLLRDVWSHLERHYYEIDIGLAYMEALPIEEIKDYLRDRVTRLKTTLKYIGEHRDKQMARHEVPRLAAAVFDHSLAHYRAELEWTRDLLARVEEGEYP
jgi:DNA-binding PadR family transcriptional regulator